MGAFILGILGGLFAIGLFVVIGILFLIGVIDQALFGDNENNKG